MIIQPTHPSINQAIQPDLRAHGATAVKTVEVVAVQHAPQPPSVEELKNAVAEINQVMRQANQALEFSVDSETHRTVVRMVDTSTGELLRQIPSEETLAISRGIDQFQQGLLLKQKA